MIIFLGALQHSGLCATPCLPIHLTDKISQKLKVVLEGKWKWPLREKKICSQAMSMACQNKSLSHFDIQNYQNTKIFPGVLPKHFQFFFPPLYYIALSCSSSLLSLCFNCCVNIALLGQIHSFTRKKQTVSYLMKQFVSASLDPSMGPSQFVCCTHSIHSVFFYLFFFRPPEKIHAQMWQAD